MILPINIFNWLFFLIPPILVFSVVPWASPRLRAGRLVLALVLTWAALNLSVQCRSGLVTPIFTCYHVNHKQDVAIYLFDTDDMHESYIVSSKNDEHMKFLNFYKFHAFFTLGWIVCMTCIAIWESVYRLIIFFVRKIVNMLIDNRINKYSKNDFGISISNAILILGFISPTIFIIFDIFGKSVYKHYWFIAYMQAFSLYGEIRYEILN